MSSLINRPFRVRTRTERIIDRLADWHNPDHPAKLVVMIVMIMVIGWVLLTLPEPVRAEEAETTQEYVPVDGVIAIQSQPTNGVTATIIVASNKAAGTSELSCAATVLIAWTEEGEKSNLPPVSGLATADEGQLVVCKEDRLYVRPINRADLILYGIATVLME